MTESDIATYCREIETHLCRKNDGHLIRIVGPSFDAVAGWAAKGIPLKVALAGIDRYFDRYYRKGARRRPVKVDFCDADVLDVFDEWRRATGLTAPLSPTSAHHEPRPDAERRRGASLPEHLERVLTRLSSLRATGTLPETADAIADSVSAELDRARKPGGLRGDDRQALLVRLQHLDSALMSIVAGAAHPDMRAAALAEADHEVSPFRATMDDAAFEHARDLVFANLLRDKCHIPLIAYL